MVDKSKWYNKALSPVLYEPDWAFHQPEIDDRKWIKPPWQEWHPIRTGIDRNISFAEKEEKRVDRWKQANLQKTLNGKLIEVPLESKGNGKPYCGPNWSEETDEQEPQPELAIDPSLWKFPKKFNPVAQYNRYWNRKNRPRTSLRNLNWRQAEADKEVDYLPFIFYSWREMPRLSIQERARMETEEDGMVITSEIEKGEWD